MEEQDEGEKTEEPSPYRIEEIRQKGVVAISRELVNLIMLLASTATVYFLFNYYLHKYRVLFEFITQIPFKENDVALLSRYGEPIIMFFLQVVGPLFLVVMFFGIASHVIQYGFLFSPEIINFDLNRVNPVEGVKRIFSKKMFVDLFKIVLKFSLISSVAIYFVYQNFFTIRSFIHLELGPYMYVSKDLIAKCIFFIGIALSFVAALDLWWERFSYKQKLLQTRRELKEEQKEREGNPEIRQRIRMIQRDLAHKRMMNDVPKADVIVTNPTHVSVALKYDIKKMASPKVVAKGVDLIALKIRQIANENNIPIVENAPLARSMYKSIKVGEYIPRDFYKAVAEILAFVYRKKGKKL